MSFVRPLPNGNQNYANKSMYKDIASILPEIYTTLPWHDAGFAYRVTCFEQIAEARNAKVAKDMLPCATISLVGNELGEDLQFVF